MPINISTLVCVYDDYKMYIHIKKKLNTMKLLTIECHPLFPPAKEKSTKMKFLFCLSILWASSLAALSPNPNIAQDMRITCDDQQIHVSIDTNSDRFTGMIYPRGLSKNSTCLMEFTDQKSPLQYTLPLRWVIRPSSARRIPFLIYRASPNFLHLCRMPIVNFLKDWTYQGSAPLANLLCSFG